jgi:cell division protein ZapA
VRYDEPGTTEDVEVEIYGQTFRVAAGEASTTYIQQLAAYVDERMHAIAHSAKTASLTRVAILAALNIADDLLKLREDYEHSAHLFETITTRLLALVQAHDLEPGGDEPPPATPEV